jgi:hypothetical protein
MQPHLQPLAQALHAANIAKSSGVSYLEESGESRPSKSYLARMTSGKVRFGNGTIVVDSL